MTDLDGLWWLLASLIPLLYLQRRLHGEMMAVFLLITRSEKIAMVLFSLLFFPGVVIHELSHWITAVLLGVHTGKIWLLPEQQPDGTLRLGYVEVTRPDFVRDSIIGFAPMVFGGLFVGYAGLYQLKFNLLWESMFNVEWKHLSETLSNLYSQTDFWLWFYLVFVVSAMMVPSPSDRYAWRSLILFTAMIFVFALAAGAGQWMIENMAPLVNEVFRSAAIVFGISNLVHLVLLFPTVLFRQGLNRITGLTIVNK